MSSKHSIILQFGWLHLSNFQMLRKEREMRKDDALRFLQEAKVGRLGVCQNDQSYVVPVLFVYDAETNAIYIHSSKKGKKIEIMKANPNVCFEIDQMFEIILNKSPCNCDVAYRSVIVFGKASFIDSPKDKVKALNMLLRKYFKEANSTTSPEMANPTQIIRIKVASIVGKENKKGIKNSKRSGKE